MERVLCGPTQPSRRERRLCQAAGFPGVFGVFGGIPDRVLTGRIQRKSVALQSWSASYNTCV